MASLSGDRLTGRSDQASRDGTRGHGRQAKMLPRQVERPGPGAADYERSVFFSSSGQHPRQSIESEKQRRAKQPNKGPRPTKVLRSNERERGQITSQKGSIQPRAQVAETVNIAISSRAADQTKQSAYAACCRYLPLLLWAHMTRQKDAGYSHRHRVCDTVLLMVHCY